jgi:hypothetical protein
MIGSSLIVIGKQNGKQNGKQRCYHCLTVGQTRPGLNRSRVEVAELFGISDCCGWDFGTRFTSGVGAKELVLMVVTEISSFGLIFEKMFRKSSENAFFPKKFYRKINGTLNR